MPTPFIGRLLDTYRKKAFHFVFTFKDVFYRVAVILFVATILIWLSIFMYGTFYYFYMPAVSHVRQVDLHFKSCGENAGICSFPSANVTLTRRLRERLLTRGQPYRVLLTLDVPESPVNQDLGMFMVHTSMLGVDGLVLRQSERGAIMRYRSALLRTIYTLVAWPLLLVGTVDEKQTINVELFPLYEEHPDATTTYVYVEIRSRFIQIYTATLHIHAHFTGLRYLMFYYPVVTAICGISMNLFFLLLVAAFSWHHWFLSPFYHQHSVVKVEFDGDGSELYRQKDGWTAAGASRRTSLSLEARRAELREKLGQKRNFTNTALLSEADVFHLATSPSGFGAGFQDGRRTRSFSVSRTAPSPIDEIPWEAVQQYQQRQAEEMPQQQQRKLRPPVEREGTFPMSPDSTCEELDDVLFMKTLDEDDQRNAMEESGVRTSSSLLAAGRDSVVPVPQPDGLAMDDAGGKDGVSLRKRTVQAAVTHSS